MGLPLETFWRAIFCAVLTDLLAITNFMQIMFLSTLQRDIDLQAGPFNILAWSNIDTCAVFPSNFAVFVL